jgi:NACalpha-BTF3-like transcription factor
MSDETKLPEGPELPDVLENIVGEFSDRPTYKKSIQYNQNVHTRKNLCNNDLKDIPEDDIYLFAEAYKLSKEYVILKHPNILISPMDYIGIFIELLQFYGIIDLKDLLEKKITSIEGTDTISGYILNRIDKETTYKINLGNSAARNFWDSLSKLQKYQFSMAINGDTKGIDYDSIEYKNGHSDEEYNILNAIERSIENIKNRDPNFFPMTNIMEYYSVILEDIIREEQRSKEEEEKEREEESDEEEEKWRF